jgi:hypothetical protein
VEGTDPLAAAFEAADLETADPGPLPAEVGAAD